MTLPTAEWLFCLEGGTSISCHTERKGLMFYSDSSSSWVWCSLVSHSSSKNIAALNIFTLTSVKRKLYGWQYTEKDDTSENKTTNRLKVYRHYLALLSVHCKFCVYLIYITLSFIKCTVMQNIAYFSHNQSNAFQCFTVWCTPW